MELGLICCNRARSWTRAIAWIQIVGCAFGLLLSGGALIAVLLASEDVVHDGRNEIISTQNRSSHSDNAAKLDPAAYIKMLIILVIFVMVFFLGVVMGVLLLTGATEKNVRYLKGWICFVSVMFTWSVVATIFSAEDVVVLVVRLLVSSGIYGYIIAVVIILILEIEVDQRFREEKSVRYKDVAGKDYPTTV